MSKMFSTPHEAVESKLQLSSDRIKLAQELSVLQNEKAVAWLELRKDCNTDKETDRKWSASEKGQRETTLRMEIKGIDIQISAINTYLRNAENEANNIF